MSGDGTIDVEATVRRLTAVRKVVSFFRRVLSDRSDLSLLDEIDHAASQALESMGAEASFSVALLGESGAGKSSLINAIAGLDLLPHNSGRAVTASVCEVTRGDSDFLVEVEFRDVKDSLEMVRGLGSRLLGAAEDRVDAGSGTSSLQLDDGDSRLIEAITGRSPEDCVSAASSGLDSLLLDDARIALTSGGCGKFDFPGATGKEVQDCVEQYLSSARNLWPFVQRVSVTGPFETMPHGVRLVDVPGLNDPDPSRDRVAREHLQQAGLVWLVLSAKRAATGEIVRFLTESRLLTRLQLDGRLGSVAVVVTHADQLDEEGLIRELRLPEDITFDELLSHHVRRTEGHVRSELLKVWDETVRQADFDPEQFGRIRDGRNLLDRIQVFCVDSRQFMLARRIMRTPRGAIRRFDSEEQTGIPKLLEWLGSEFIEKERKSAVLRATDRADRLEKEIRSVFGHRKAVKQALEKWRNATRGGVGDVKQGAATFLQEQITAHKEESRIKAETEAARVTDAIHRATEEARSMLRSEVPDELKSIHWSTLRAIVRRRGVFHGTAKRWDIPQQIADRIASKLVFRWSGLFENFATSFLNSLESKSVDLVAQHRHVLYQAVAAALGEASTELLPERQEQQSLSLGFDLAQAAVSQQLRTTRLGFSAALVDCMRRELSPAFDAAAKESGRGMKDRIVLILLDKLEGSVPTVVAALNRDIEGQVAAVKAMLLARVADAHHMVAESAMREAANMEADLRQTSDQELRRQIGALEQGLSLLSPS